MLPSSFSSLTRYIRVYCYWPVEHFSVQLRMRDFTKLSASPVFGVTSAERAARGVEKDESDQEAFASGGGGLTLRDYQLEVMR